MIFLGVDGGGTGTDLALVDEHGTVLASSTAPSMYYFGHPQGIGLVEQVLAEAVPALCSVIELVPSSIDHAFFALAGYGEVAADVARLDAIPADVLGHDRYACDNDMVAGWAGSLGLVDGINVVAGTGSIVYGRRGATGLRVGGWGELFGDEGSAYWIAVEGLRAFSRMADGRSPTGPLLPMLRAELRLDGDLDLIDVVLVRWGSDRSRVAALAPLVSAAAEAGDPACRAILDRAVDELLATVTTAREGLGFDSGSTVPVSFSGGVFRSPAVQHGFTSRLAADGYEVREPITTPVLGAARYAASLAGLDQQR